MTTTTAPKVTTRRLADTAVDGSRFGAAIINLKSYAVLVDGEQVGIVEQQRASTMNGYRGSSLGHETTRTCWAWTSEDNCGDSEIRTRKEAIADLVDFALTT